MGGLIRLGMLSIANGYLSLSMSGLLQWCPLSYSLHAMGDPVSFSRNDDTTVHLSVVRGFLDSGTFSTLNVTKYLDLWESGGYYPAAWHVVTAVVASLVGNQVALATNAMIFVVCVFVLPVGVLYLLRQLFPDNKLALYAGSLFSGGVLRMPLGLRCVRAVAFQFVVVCPDTRSVRFADWRLKRFWSIEKRFCCRLYLQHDFRSAISTERRLYVGDMVGSICCLVSVGQTF